MSSSNRYFYLCEGCPDYLTASKPLYERKAVTRIWNSLTEVAKKQWKWKNLSASDKKAAPFAGEVTCRILQVFGPPGSGKSCATYGWVESICRSLNVKAVWLSWSTQAGRIWSIQQTQGVGKLEANLQSVPKEAADCEDAMVVVFDGIRKSTIETWRPLMNEIARLGIAVIVVSSERVRFHEGDSSDIAKPEHLVPSWTLEEYTAACSDDRFWAACLNKFSGATVADNLARREELLREKFAVAGHSARYMFKLLVEEVRTKIEGAAQGMGGITTLEDAAKHTRCEGAVNTLVARLLPIVEDGVTLAQAAVFPIKEDTELVAAGLEDVAPTAGEI